MKQFFKCSFVVTMLFGGVALPAQVRVDVSPKKGPSARARVGPVDVTASTAAAGVAIRIAPGRSTPNRSTGPKAGSARTRSSARAARVLSTADRYVGTRYVYGGTTPRGFDCSGFVQYVFRRHGVSLPRTSREQGTSGRKVAAGLRGIRPGDLLLFATKGKRIDHVAIYAGGDRIIHSSASGGGVRYDNLRSKRGRWLTKHHVASRRVLENGAPLVAHLTGSEGAGSDVVEGGVAAGP